MRQNIDLYHTMDTIPINVHRNTPPLPESGEIKTPIRGHDWFHLVPAKNRERERANCKKKRERENEEKEKSSNRDLTNPLGYGRLPLRERAGV